MSLDPVKQLIADHQIWLGHLQPVGLVVSARALAEAGVGPLHPRQAEVQTALSTLQVSSTDEVAPVAGRDLVQQVLGWEASDWVTEGVAALAVPLPDYGEVLAPSAAVPDPDAEGRWLLLVQELSTDTDFDVRAGEEGHGWPASPQVRMERLLRETDVAIGLLLNGHQVRLVYAPRGETSGHVTWSLAPLSTVAGRQMLGGLWATLGSNALFTGGAPERLPNLLIASRRYQSDVSSSLAGQVYEALSTLLNGFQQADALAGGVLLGPLLKSEPETVYGGLLATMMRLVFLLYAEERDLMPDGPLYQQHYSVTQLFARLRADAATYPDLMDSRYGAWPRLLAVFRMVHDGCVHPSLHLPERRGRLFDPDTYPFLEGRSGPREPGVPLVPPRVPDGVALRMLEKLLILDGDRLSYRALDVEQVGAVYEAMMGFEVQQAAGRALPLTIKVKKQKLKLVVVADVEHILGLAGAARAKWLKGELGIVMSGKAAVALKGAKTPEDLAAALAKRIPPGMYLLPPGSLYLQPTPRRRLTGSHYTPASLTGPIVATALRPVLEALGPKPTAERLLALRICDPAMGSGAFLVQACRLLADRIVQAWTDHGEQPEIPPDEDPILFARRLVAQRCLYGVDLNPFAVDLGKLSLWLATLAREHPFTFLDHALVAGDALVGLLEPQLRRMDWQVNGALVPMNQILIDNALATARAERRGIHHLADSDKTDAKIKKLLMARSAIRALAMAADGVVAAFFSAEKDRARRKALVAHHTRWATAALGGDIEAASVPMPLPALHWPLVFPEVFDGLRPGFDVIIGNPPFMGKNTVSQSYPAGYVDWLQAAHPCSHGNADLVAHFYRRAFSLLRSGGTMGLIATKTIAQGDTRSTGLEVILAAGGSIYEATRRRIWPGDAAVVVSVVHVIQGSSVLPAVLDGRPVPRISAFLAPGTLDKEPAVLKENGGLAFQGSIVLGIGFTFDDTDSEATSIAEMEKLVDAAPACNDVILPYIGGGEVNEVPGHWRGRYVIHFGTRGEEECRAHWPELVAIVETKVRGKRGSHSTAPWWQFERPRIELSAAISSMDRVVVRSLTSKHFCFTFVKNQFVFDQTLIVFANETFGFFAAICSRVHELWAGFFGASLEDRPRYNIESCFETFPFPANWHEDSRLESAGRILFNFRAELLVRFDTGMTALYNRFHDPSDNQVEIVELRACHEELDRAMFLAYGWSNLEPSYMWEPQMDEGDEEDENDFDGKRRKKMIWRQCWPEDLRDEVFVRLLDLNAERAGKENISVAFSPTVTM